MVDYSIKHLTKGHTIADFELINQNGETITQNDYKNKIYIADFFFTRCPGICVAMAYNMGELQEFYKTDDDILFLSHSVTPVMDSVSVLRAYADKKGVIDGKWNVTTGSKNTIIGGYHGNQGGLDIRTSSNNIVLSDGDGNPRLKIDSTGAVMIDGGQTSVGPDGSSTDTNSTEIGRGYINLMRDDTVGIKQILFGKNGNEVGSISTGASSTSFNTASDYRLKENVDYTFDATTRLKQLKPARFNFIADADTTVDGFLAHEVASVVPEAISGTKDEVDSDGNPVYQGIDQSKLVPLLVKTIQELEARITALES